MIRRFFRGPWMPACVGMTEQMMQISGSMLVVGGADLIGSHTIDQLVKEDVGEILVYDNFTRGRSENLADALKDPPRSYLRRGW